MVPHASKHHEYTLVGTLRYPFLGITASIAPVAADSTTAYFEINSESFNAYACIDHWNCGNTPIMFSTDPNSYHTITVYKEGYQMSTQRVYANGPGVKTGITVALVSNTPVNGNLDIDTNTTGAGIWVDMRYYGKTPQIVGGLSAGIHSLTLKKAGYYDLKQEVMISSGETTSSIPPLAAYPEQPGYGSLRIESTPGGAAIFMNNNYQGATLANGDSFDINQLTPGTYALKLTLPHYRTYTRTIEVREGMVYDIHAVMAAVTPGATPDTTGDITVRSGPSGANIYLDNAFRGITPLTLADIPQGSHAITLKMNGYQDWQSSVNILGGSITDVSGTLVRNPTPNPTAYVTQLAPLPTQSPAGLVSIISAIGICGAAAVLYRINKKE
jgi:hypothetical protein